MRLDVIGAIEACYRPGDDSTWARGLLDALAPLDQGHGMMAVSFDLAVRRWRVLATHGNLPDVSELLRAYLEAPPAILLSHLRPSPPVDTGSRRGTNNWAPLRGFLRSRGVDDALGVMAVEHDRCGIFLWAPYCSGFAPAPRTVNQLTCLSAHVVAARRLRGEMVDDDPCAPAGAILTPTGSVQDASGSATEANTQRVLGESVRRIERARGRARRVDPEGALALWEGLVNGEWSLVDHVDTDGRRFVLARRNQPGVRDPKALSTQERDVLGYAALGHSNKFIGYMLGLAPNTVATHLHSAQRKLGVRSRIELIRAFGNGTKPQPPASTDSGT